MVYESKSRKGAEEPLPAGGSCLLGSINLSEYVADAFKPTSHFDYLSFIKDIPTITKGMNEVLHEGLLLHPLQEQKESVNNWRQIGIGIMGLHDALLKMGIRYGSDESIDVCNHIGSILIDNVLLSSSKLVDEYGAYPNYNKDAVLKSEFLKANASKSTLKLIKEKGLANSQLLTIAPTGSLSTMLGISGGVEPIFNVSYTRKTESLHGKDEYYKVYTPIIKTIMDNLNIENEEDLPNYITTAMNLDYKERINMQQVWQNHIDAAISSTVNVPESFTIEQIEDLYMLAWGKGLKGITIYRDNCSRAGILTNEETKEPTSESDEEFELPRGYIIDTMDDLIGKKTKIMTGCGSLHIQAWFSPEDGEIMELFLSKGSAGGCEKFMTGLSRMVSLAARGGISTLSIIDQLHSTGVCASYAVRNSKFHDTSKGSSCCSGIAYAIEKMYKEIQSEINDDEEEIEIKPILVKKENNEPKTFKVKIEDKTLCPECGEKLINEGGCNSCKSCGYSKCL